MFPDVKTQTSEQTAYTSLMQEFVGETRSQLSTLTGEIALRNRIIQENDAYIYDDLLMRMLDIPLGHDRTPVNWLRRTVEIHRHQMMGKGFQISSSYHQLDESQATNPQEQQMLSVENQKRQTDAEKRSQILEAIMRDNGGDALWARLAENSSAIGTSVLKTFFDPKLKKYTLSMIEAVEHCYAIWSRDNFRQYDAFAYVYQVSKQEAVRDYNVGENVATSPLGMPLAVLSSANIVEYISTQPMVTIMEINGRIQGWQTNNGILSRCPVGEETEMNAVIVGDKVHRMIDQPKYMPHYYILPNKLVRRRPWGLPDVSRAAIHLNLTYIETLSDWRTNAHRINFPKWKGIGFGPGVAIPKPKPRTAEILPLNAGQDIQPLMVGNGAESSTKDFPEQLAEIKEEFVREVGISQVLFDNPDVDMNSKQAMNQSMGSISDLVDAKRQLWSPIIRKICEDAFDQLSLWDDGIKSINDPADDWWLRITWPSGLQVEDPTYQAMLMNRLNANTISLQTYLERMGETKEELDRIKTEMGDKVLSAIHGKQIGLLAELSIMPPPSSAPPKIAVSLRGDLTPDQEANVAAMHGFNDGPVFGPTEGPQGNLGNKATEDEINNGMITGQPYNTGQPIQRDASGNPIPVPNPNFPAPPQASGPGSPAQPLQQITTPGQNQPGQQPTSQPGSGATPTSPQGKLNKSNQNRGG